MRALVAFFPLIREMIFIVLIRVKNLQFKQGSNLYSFIS